MLLLKVIKNLLEYQAKDKQRLELLQSVEGGKCKREINLANKTVNGARENLLVLENDAKELQNAFTAASKNLNEHVERIEKLKSQAQPKNEDEIQSLIAYISALLQKVNMLEGQLEGIGKNIAYKTKAFEDIKNQVIKAQTTIKNLTPQYQAQLDKIKPQLAELEADLKKIAATIDAQLLEKYKNRRKTETSGKIVDIVVPVSKGRCGACFFEMPLSLVHKISTNGYIVCEECTKIIYNG